MKTANTNIRFIVQKVKNESSKEEEHFQEKLLNLLSGNNHPQNEFYPAILELNQYNIKDSVVGPNHLAFLLQDGRVCRLGYSVFENEEIAAPTKSTDDNYKDQGSPVLSSRSSRDGSRWTQPDLLGMGGGSWGRWGSRIGVIRSTASESSNSNSMARKRVRRLANENLTPAGLPSPKIRLIRTGQVRGRNLSLLSGQRAVVPASQVPEDLVNQVQNVLQGKSHSVIVKELQRTSLDVNLAVNNLLSRDDEDNDDMDETGSDFIPGEELMSLLDGGMHSGGEHPRVVIDTDSMLSDEIFGFSLPNRSGSTSATNTEDYLPNFNNTDFHDVIKAGGSKTRPTAPSSASGSNSNMKQESGVWLDKKLQWWVDDEKKPILFKLIGSMYSDLVGVDIDGKLREWEWEKEQPSQGPDFHFRSNFLKIENAKVAHLSCCETRASICTEDGEIATWMDRSVSKHTVALDDPCKSHDAIKNEKIKSLHTCSLYSAILTEQGRIYWWGVMPFALRKKVWEGTVAQMKQNQTDSMSKKPTEIEVGSQVCLKNFPIYHAGALGINVVNGKTKVGKLLQSVWELDKKYSFEIVNSEAEEVKTSDPTQENESSSPVCLKKRKRTSESPSEYKEEEWKLNNVIFFGETRSIPVGVVTKVDENIVAVNFNSDKDDLSSCRLLHKNDVIEMKSPVPCILECIQTTPKRLQIDSQLNIHCITAVDSHLTAIVSKAGEHLALTRFNLWHGKCIMERSFPSKASEFIDNADKSKDGDSKRQCKLINGGVGCPTLLLDSNSMLYPLLNDEHQGIRDPIWADISSLHSVCMGVYSGSQEKNRYAVTVLSFKSQILMPWVLQRNLKVFESLISKVDTNKEIAWPSVFYQSLVNEKCDGQRNIFHMCVEMSIPSSNKEQKSDEKEKKEFFSSKISKFLSPTNVTQESGNIPLEVPSEQSKLPEPKPSTSGSTQTNTDQMDDSDRSEAVSAIASAISSVIRTGGRNAEQGITTTAPSTSQSPAKVSESSSDRSEESTMERQSSFMKFFTQATQTLDSLLANDGSPPESPVSTWPPELSSYWNNVEREEEEGLNLSTSSNSSTKPKKESKSINWNEVKEGRGSRLDAVAILDLLCVSKCTIPYMETLLTQKDSNDYTPFMFAVAHRAYPAAKVLFGAAYCVAREKILSQDGDAKEKLKHADILKIPRDLTTVSLFKHLSPMIYPEDSHPDDNPLYMICCNDNCSFTWTGALHINQEIFECLTCGLTESLCCCSECAKVCHKGHDCKLKTTNPTAYCDCWEKCVCKSLIAGDNNDRKALIQLLMRSTDLYELPDSSGQHIVHFLLERVARQMEEQKQYRRPRKTSRMSAPSRPRISRVGAGKPLTPSDQDMPEHDLNPPVFCGGALHALLSDPFVLHSLIMVGCEGRRDEHSISYFVEVESEMTLHPEDMEVFSSESGTTRLDMFTHTLLVKCSSFEFLNQLLETLIHLMESGSKERKAGGKLMARRFIRSVIRVFLIIVAQSTPDKLAKRTPLSSNPMLTKCRKAFMALLPVAVEELCEMAESLITPVRMGVACPTVEFPLLSTHSDVIVGSAALFNVHPFKPRNQSDDEETKNNQDDAPNTKRSHHGKRKKGGSKRPSTSRGHQSRSRRGSYKVEDPQTSQESKNSQANEEEDEENESDMDIINDLINDSDSDSYHTIDSDQTITIGRREEEGSDDQEDEEDTDSDHFTWREESPLERQSTRHERVQARRTPHAMQWAMGRDRNAASSSRAPSLIPAIGTNPSTIVYIDSLRRESNWEEDYVNSILDRRQGITRPKPADTPLYCSSAITNTQLARLFATCVREVSHLLSSLSKGSYLSDSTLFTMLEISPEEDKELQQFVSSRFEKTWSWLLTVVEATERKLKYGQILSTFSSPNHPEHPQHEQKKSNKKRRGRDNNASNSKLQENKRSFLAYALSLMRSHSNEHSDFMPKMNISSLRHVAYVLDAYIYYLRGTSNLDTGSKAASSHPIISFDIGYDNSDNEDYENSKFFPGLYSDLQLDPGNPSAPRLYDDLLTEAQPMSSFFRRSESMCFLGVSDSKPFEVSMVKGLPLAEEPHLLQPSAGKEELFGREWTFTNNEQTYANSMSLSHRAGYKKEKNHDDESTKIETSSGSTKKSDSESSEDHENKNVEKSEEKAMEVEETAKPEPLVIHPSVIKSTSDVKNEEMNMPSTSNVDELDPAETPSTSVIVDVSSDQPDKKKKEKEQELINAREKQARIVNQVLGKCRLTLEVFSQSFLEDVGAEPNSILSELGGFQVRETKFRKDMERLRSGQDNDLVLNVERPRNKLIQQTLKQLNQHFKRRSGAVLRVKVLFRNEPGEGTGVARSFYTTICEAILSPEQLPTLDGILPSSSTPPGNRKSFQHSCSLVARWYKRDSERLDGVGGSRTRPDSEIDLRSFLSSSRSSRRSFAHLDVATASMSISAPPFLKKSSRSQGNQSSIERSKHAIGDRLLPKVMAIRSDWAAKITGMLISLPAYELLLLIRSERALQVTVQKAVDQLTANGFVTGDTMPPFSGAESVTLPTKKEDEKEEKDEKKAANGKEKDVDGRPPFEWAGPSEVDGGPPLFYQPGKRGFYSPTSWGVINDVRLNAYRNVGRIIGLCLLQNELCPLPLCRHVLKVILGRKVNWYDLAFFDPSLYESLRQLVVDSQSQDGGVLEALELTFMIDLLPEEGSGQTELMIGGDTVQVDKNNIQDYVRRYALHRMLGCCKLQLDKLRQGVYDVLPTSALQSLTAEDLRLLVNGCGNVDVRTLISYTMFNDESGKTGSTSEKLTQFKQWFWSVVHRFSAMERQQLLYFWTGSPALPASEDGFQPMPTITIRPPDDQHLPTANTCISRLYVPLYSSRQILKQKLSVAIQTKNFGFV